MKKRAKRCGICASKLDAQGNCPWSGCPASPKYQTKEETKDESKPKPKAETTNS